MEVRPSVQIEGDTIVDAFRNTVRRIPESARAPSPRREPVGGDDLGRLRPRRRRGHRRARRAGHRIGPAGRDLLQQPGRVAPRRLRDARQRQRDRAPVSDQLVGTGRIHPRPRRGARLLRREPRAGGQDPRSQRSAAQARPRRRLRRRRAARRSVRRAASNSCAPSGRRGYRESPVCSTAGRTRSRPTSWRRSCTRAARPGRPKGR